MFEERLTYCPSRVVRDVLIGLHRRYPKVLFVVRDDAIYVVNDKYLTVGFVRAARLHAQDATLQAEAHVVRCDRRQDPARVQRRVGAALPGRER